MRPPKEEIENFHEPVTAPHSHTNNLKDRKEEGGTAPEERVERRGGENEREEMTRGVLEAVIEDLADDPLDGSYETRTYKITEHEDGQVTATCIPHGDAVAKELEGRGKESKEKKESGEEVIKQVRSARPITKKGSDPPPSDRWLGKRAKTRKLKF